MNDCYLSDDELAVLSSLLGGSVVYGVDSKLFSDWHRSYQEVLNQTMNRLQEKKIISIDYEGRIRIKKEIYEWISVLVQPEELLLTLSTSFDGKKEENYYYKKNHQIVHMKKGKNYHQLVLQNEISMSECEALELNEEISNKDIKAVNDYLEWFDEDGAIEYLKKHTQQPLLVYSILDKQFDEVMVEYYRWDGKEVIQKEKVMVGTMNQKTFEWVESNDMISLNGGNKHFTSILQMMNAGVK